MEIKVFYKYFFPVLGIFFLAQQLSAQQADIEFPLSIKNGISKPNTLATHPFGLLFYSLPHNFRKSATKRIKVAFDFSGGNIWGQTVTTYIPQDPLLRESLKDVPFYSRIFEFDPRNDDAQNYTIGYDGVLKDLRVGVVVPLSAKNELSLGARTFILTNGSFPFTTLASDRVIEFFHSNLAGGEDPFGRKVLGFDKAGIVYNDRDGNTLEIAEGEMVFSGLEMAFYHYPSWLNERRIYLNMGLHLGNNLSRYNRSIDLGVSMGSLKSYDLSGNTEFMIGMGLNLLRKSFLEFNTDQTDLGTSNFFGSFEGHLELDLANKNGGHHSIGINYRIQTPYNRKSEESYYVPENPDRIKRWHDASRHLYKFPSYWSLIYAFTKKFEFAIYVQEDLLVNNAPDFQTGIRFQFPL